MATSNVQDLKTKRNEAGLAFNKLNEDPEFQRLRVATQTAFNDYKAKSAEADRLFREGAPREQQEAARAASSQALDSWKPYDAQYQPLFRQATALRNEVNVLDTQIAEIANTATSPPEDIARSQQQQTAAAANSAKNTSSAQPPVEATNVVTAKDNPEAFAASTPIEPVDPPSFTGDESSFVPTPPTPSPTPTERYIPPSLQPVGVVPAEDFPLEPADQGLSIAPGQLEVAPTTNFDVVPVPLTTLPTVTVVAEPSASEERIDADDINDFFASEQQRLLEQQPKNSSTVIEVTPQPRVATLDITNGNDNTTVPNSSGLNDQVPGLQVFDDGSSIQTLDDGSVIVTDADGNVSSRPAPDIDSESGSTFPFLSRPEQVVGSPAKDIRFRISLARSATYLYKSPNPGILSPLAKTDGVIFPYTPQVQVTYTAAYSSNDLTHSNYKIHNYKGSSVDSVQVSGDFTAQDSVEANYLLAVIHFFRSATKMFYGQDNYPARGVPPPLVYLSGFGQYQFDNHPALITSFNYVMPTDVDYINAYPTNPTSSFGGFNLSQYVPQIAQYISPLDRLRSLGGGGLLPGGTAPPPVFNRSNNVNEVTRVPTKINIQLGLIPVVTRNAISNKFSLQKYASGDLLRGSVNPGTGGGIW